MPTKNRIGHRAKDSTLLNVDKRSREGKFLAEVHQSLVEHLGGAPSVPERIMIDLIKVKMLRLALIAGRVGDLTKDDADRVLAWSNGLRRDLETIGLKAPERQLPRLADYLSRKGAA